MPAPAKLMLRLCSAAVSLLLLLLGAETSPFAGGLVPTPTPQPHPAPHVVSGAQPFLVVLCHLSDAARTADSPAVFEDLLFGPAPSLDDYWREVSYGKISLAGSRVAGWHDLGKSSEAYFQAQGVLDIQGLARDCAGAAATGADLTPYPAVILVFDKWLNKEIYAGSACVETDAGQWCGHTVWLWAFSSFADWVHEMGHVFGIEHSASAAGALYTDDWDPMGEAGECACDMAHGITAQHVLAQAKAQLGWIPPSVTYLAAPGATATITLERLAQPPGGGYLLAVIPRGDLAQTYYTVEARLRTGYDAALPVDAVVIHLVDPACTEHPAHLVTHPGDTRTGAGASAWTPGDVFIDAAAGISVSVEEPVAAGFRVTVRTGLAAQTIIAEALRGPALALLDGPAQLGALLPEQVMMRLAPADGAAVYSNPGGCMGLGFRCTLTAVSWSSAGRWAVEALDPAWTASPGARPALAAGGDDLAVAWSGWARSSDVLPLSRVGWPDLWVVRRGDHGVWGPPFCLSPEVDRPMEDNPALVLAPDGHLAAAWCEYATDGWYLVFRSEQAPGRWNPVERVSDPGARWCRGVPALAIDSPGNVQIVWVDERPERQEILAGYRSANGEWAANQRLAQSTHLLTSPALATDSLGNSYATWVESLACWEGGGFGQLFVAERPAGAAWQRPLMLADHVDGGAESLPAITVDREGLVYVAWEEYEGAGIALYVARRQPSGQWLPALTAVRARTTTLMQPGLGVDAAGNVVIAWAEETAAGQRLEVARLAR